MYQRYAWPSAHTGSMHIEGGTMVAYKREIENAADPRAKRQEIEARLEAIASPFRNAHALDIENLIDPRETRPLLVEFVREAQAVLATQLGPTAGSVLPALIRSGSPLAHRRGAPGGAGAVGAPGAIGRASFRLRS